MAGNGAMCLFVGGPAKVPKFGFVPLFGIVNVAVKSASGMSSCMATMAAQLIRAFSKTPKRCSSVSAR
jgi:CTP-dependent riboflavin kinase